MTNTNERRRDTRRPLHEDVQIRVVDEKIEVIARCSNISASGMLVQSPSMIKVGSQLSISLPKNENGFDADGEVIRVVKDNKHFLIAIRLTDIQQ